MEANAQSSVWSSRGLINLSELAIIVELLEIRLETAFMVAYIVFSGRAEHAEAIDFMFSQSLASLNHLKIVAFCNRWYLKVALSVGEVANLKFPKLQA